MSTWKSVSISVKTFFFGDQPFLGWKSVWISDFGRKIRLNFGEDLFFFETTCFWAEKAFEFPILAEKSVSISVKTFFFETTCFWAEKAFEFPILAEISVSISRINWPKSDKPCDFDSRTMKIRVKVVCSFLTLSKKPPPPLFFKSWLSACVHVCVYPLFACRSCDKSWFEQLPLAFSRFANLRGCVGQWTYSTPTTPPPFVLRLIFYLHSTNSNAAKKALQFSGAQIWNSLQPRWKDLSFYKFKEVVKGDLLYLKVQIKSGMFFWFSIYS